MGDKIVSQGNKAPQNRTLRLLREERKKYKTQLLKIDTSVSLSDIQDRIINQDIHTVLDYLPPAFVDLLFIDPPYNLTKTFNKREFKQKSVDDYAVWMQSWLMPIKNLLKPTASIYVCGDWRSSAAIHRVCEKLFIVRNRITFEREKGRGAKRNWKNNSEDIWFCTMSDDYYFNSDAVKLKKQIIAPYRIKGIPKDWKETDGGKYRLTYPSNIWTDITIPFWSMPENTSHPTQKPEKLLAKIILASSRKGEMIFDPFAGVGTSGVVAKKLSRSFTMVEIDEEYCCLALKRLHMITGDNAIQGYSDGVFWERNTLRDIKKYKKKRINGYSLFPEQKEGNDEK